MLISEAQKFYVSRIRVFKCSWQRPALLSTKVNLHFELQTFTGTKAWAEFIIKQTRRPWLSPPPRAGEAPPQPTPHRGPHANPYDLLCMSLKEKQPQQQTKNVIKGNYLNHWGFSFKGLFLQPPAGSSGNHWDPTTAKGKAFLQSHFRDQLEQIC